VVSASSGLVTNGSLIMGGTTRITNGGTGSFTELSSSGYFQNVGPAILQSTLGVTGTANFASLMGVTASHGVSASFFMGDGSRLTGIAGGGGGISWDGSTANGIATFKDSDEATVESNLTFDGTNLKVVGNVSGSGVLQNVGATILGNTLTVSGAVSGAVGATFSSVTATQPGSTSQFAAVTATSLSSSGILQNVGATILGNTLAVSGASTLQAITTTGISGSGTLHNVGAATFGSTLATTGSITTPGLTASQGVSASYFMGDGSRLTGIAGGGGISFNGSTANGLVTYGNVSTADVESNLTFDGSNLKVVGTISGSSTLHNVGATTLGSTLSVTGAVSGAVAGTFGALTADGGFSMQGSTIISAAREITCAGYSGSGVLQTAGVTILGDTLVVSGNAGVGISIPKTALDVHHNPTSLANDTGGGEVVKFGTGTTVAGKTYYLHSSSNWYETSVITAASGGLGMVAVALGTSPAVNGMLLRGFFDYNTYLTGTFVAGATVYLTASGGVTVLRPSGSGESLRVLGTCTTTANVIYFNPSPDYLVIS
jgi:hypothetical protein